MKAICLRCKKELPTVTISDTGQYICECGNTIPYFHGIYQFTGQDEFYEGKFTLTHHKRRNPAENIAYTLIRLFSIDGNEDRMWRKSIKKINSLTGYKKLEILNIGAGGGHEFLNEIGTVTAVDISLQSLLSAQSIYSNCYQADAQQLPFLDNSFDLVFSSHLLGHIPLDIKQNVVKELYRVTKINGFSLHSAECEANNFVYQKAKKYPDLYKKYFQDMFGHYGLEFPSVCKKRFQNVGFVPLYEFSDYCKGIIRPANSYKIFFGAKEFREKELLFNFMASISEILSSNRPLKYISGFFLYPFTIINRIYGPDSVDSVKMLYFKK